MSVMLAGPSSGPDLTTATDSGVLALDNVTNIPSPVFMGSVAPQTTVTLFSSVHGALGTTQSDLAGVWTFNIATPLAEGHQVFTASVEDQYGNQSLLSPATNVTLDYTSPALTSIAAAGRDKVNVQFSEAVHGPDLLDPSRYALSGLGQGTLTSTPDSVTSQSANLLRASWTAGSMTYGGDLEFSFTGTNITDTAGNSLQIPAQVQQSGGGLPVAVSEFSVE